LAAANHIKSFIRSLLPAHLRCLRRVICRGELGKYAAGYRQFKKDRKLGAGDFPAYLSIAAIVKNETAYIGEWIEYHRLMGAQKFHIYDNESSDNLREFLEPYIAGGIVSYIFFPGKRRQVAAYNDAVRRYRYASFWLAFIDIDEFLVPLKSPDIAAFLRGFEDVPGIEVNQVLYGSGGQRTKTAGLVTERFKDHSPYDHPVNQGVKSIVNPRHVFCMSSAHIAEYFGGARSVDTRKNKNISASLDRPALHDALRINHYGSKSLEEFTSRIDLGRASSPGKLPVEEFFRRDHNEIKNDTIMDPFIPLIKERLEKKGNEVFSSRNGQA
jgi:hypothetical protein